MCEGLSWGVGVEGAVKCQHKLLTHQDFSTQTHAVLCIVKSMQIIHQINRLLTVIIIPHFYEPSPLLNLMLVKFFVFK